LRAGADAAARDERDRQRLRRLREQHQVPDVVLARMPRALEPVHAYAVRAEPLRRQRVFDRDALVNHDDAVRFEERDPLRGVAPRGLHDRHLLVDDHARVRAVVRRRERRQERQVHRERLRRERADASNLRAQILRGLLRQRGHGAEPARVRHRGGEDRVPDVVHPALDDRMLDPEKARDARVEDHVRSREAEARAGDEWMDNLVYASERVVNDMQLEKWTKNSSTRKLENSTAPNSTPRELHKLDGK
jgi:hypothetical protein